MSWHWRELLPVDRYTVRTADYLTDMDQKVMVLLYQPLIGTVANGLYTTLWAHLERDQWSSTEQTHRHLMLMTELSLAKIFEERKKLEGIGLLKSYKRKVDSESLYLYELQPPMTPKQFFENDVLSVYLFNRLGKTQYRELRDRFSVDTVPLDEFTELTYSFDEVYTSLHHSEMVSNLRSETGEALTAAQDKTILSRTKKQGFHFEDFDLDLMRKSLSSFIVPEQAISADVEETIIRLAFVYRIEPLEMSKIVSQAVLHDEKVDVDILRRKAQDWYRLEYGGTPPGLGLRSHPIEHKTMNQKEAVTDEEKTIQFYEETPPLRLLELRSEGAQVAPADAKIVEGLILDYQLLPGVTNVLLDYVLWQYDMKLSKPLINKIAGHWSRKKVKLVREAMQLALKEQQSKTEAQQQTSSSGNQKRQGKRNQKRDKLPKWLVEEKQSKMASEATSAGETSTTKNQQSKQSFEEMLEELRKSKQQKGGLE
ncbi:replication initiation and membrane attachment family protein [Alkalicoccobacillus murimartini]|uniref:Replication initiation and membrane attachment protein n=1 Tax=Alkalicoccobacillus murimartini TaxID=171685 RepID=A0ABT9YJQ0_9BACI|nr:helicase DnaB [Alkalicoccobacillus murimartini]MDQ0208083.1 replication initiation and membrane attachment protein [Alkalicoccobacillus murimartini]